MAFTYVTITCDYDTADGLDPSGTVTFTPTTAMINSGVVNFPAPVGRSVDVDGALSVSLAANTDSGTTPAGSAYKVVEQLNGTTRSYYVTIPHDAGSPLALSSLTVLTTAPGISPSYLRLTNTASAPATPSNGGVLYVQSGALKYKGSSGTVTTLGSA